VTGGAIRIDGQELHPTAQLGLKLLNLLAAETFESKSLTDGRSELAREAWTFGDTQHVTEVRTFSIDGPHGPVPVRLYRPEQAGQGSPMVVYYHGGGWVLGDFSAADAMIRQLANRTGVVFLSVEYRLAPEHKFPAGIDDSLCAFDYAVTHAAALGCDPALVGVAGESAGGNIAAVLSQLTAERARTGVAGPVPAFQMLLQPVTDLSSKHPSYQLFSTGFFLTEAQMDWYKVQYLNNVDEALDPRVSPLLASDLAGLCPAYVAVSGFDPLRDEGEAYAARLQEAGVPTVLRRFSAHTHGLINATGIGFVAQEMLLEVAGALRTLIAFARAK
jgi:acetyl esterase